MNTRIALSGLVAVAASLAAAPAFAQVRTYASVTTHVAMPGPMARPVYDSRIAVAPPVYTAPVYTRPAVVRHNPATFAFANRVRARMNGIEAETRAKVARRQVAPQALSAVSASRNHIEGSLQVAMADGWISGGERASLNAQLVQMDRLDAQYRLGFRGGFRGGRGW